MKRLLLLTAFWLPVLYADITLSQTSVSYKAVKLGILPVPCGNTSSALGCPNLITITNNNPGTVTIVTSVPNITGKTQQRLFPTLCTTASNGDPCTVTSTIPARGTALLFSAWDAYSMAEEAWHTPGTYTGSYTVTGTSGCSGSCGPFTVNVSLQIVANTPTLIKTVSGTYPTGCSGTGNGICPQNPIFPPSIGGIVAQSVGSFYTDLMFGSTWKTVATWYRPIAADSMQNVVSPDGTLVVAQDLYGHYYVTRISDGKVIARYAFGTEGYAFLPNDSTHLVHLNTAQPPGINIQTIGGSDTTIYTFPLATGGTCSSSSNAYCLNNQQSANVSTNGWYPWVVAGTNQAVGVTKVATGGGDSWAVGTTFTAQLPSSFAESGGNGWTDAGIGPAYITPGVDSVSHKVYVLIGPHTNTVGQASQWAYSFKPSDASPVLMFESRLPELEGGYLPFMRPQSMFFRAPACSDTLAAVSTQGGCFGAPHLALTQDSKGQQMLCTNSWDPGFASVARLQANVAVSCSYFNRGVNLMAIQVEVGGGLILNNTFWLGPNSNAEQHVGCSQTGLCWAGYEGSDQPGANDYVTAAVTSGSNISLSTKASTFTTGQNIWVGGVTGCTNANGYWAHVTVSANSITLPGVTCNGTYGGQGAVTIAGNPAYNPMSPEIHILDVRTPNKMTLWRYANSHTISYLKGLNGGPANYYQQNHPNGNSTGTVLCMQTNFGMPDQVETACSSLSQILLSTQFVGGVTPK